MEPQHNQCQPRDNHRLCLAGLDRDPLLPLLPNGIPSCIEHCIEMQVEAGTIEGSQAANLILNPN